MSKTLEKSKRVSNIKGFLGYRTRRDRDEWDSFETLSNMQYDRKRATNSSKAYSNK